MDGWTDGRMTEGMGGWMNRPADFYVISMKITKCFKSKLRQIMNSVYRRSS